MNNRTDPADYVIGPDATIEDANLDERKVYYQGQRLAEARAAELGKTVAREPRRSPRQSERRRLLLTTPLAITLAAQ